MDIAKPFNPAAPSSSASAETWAAYAGGMSCPLNHRVGLDANYCPVCGRAVPAGIREQARMLTQTRDVKVDIGSFRNL